MSKHVFYIVDLDEGTVQGTNNVEVAESFITNDSYVIIHQAGTYFCGSRVDRDVETIPNDDPDFDSEG